MWNENDSQKNESVMAQVPPPSGGFILSAQTNSNSNWIPVVTCILNIHVCRYIYTHTQILHKSPTFGVTKPGCMQKYFFIKIRFFENLSCTLLFHTKYHYTLSSSSNTSKQWTTTTLIHRLILPTASRLIRIRIHVPLKRIALSLTPLWPMQLVILRGHSRLK